MTKRSRVIYVVEAYFDNCDRKRTRSWDVANMFTSAAFLSYSAACAALKLNRKRAHLINKEMGKKIWHDRDFRIAKYERVKP